MINIKVVTILEESRKSSESLNIFVFSQEFTTIQKAETQIMLIKIN